MFDINRGMLGNPNAILDEKYDPIGTEHRRTGMAALHLYRSAFCRGLVARVWQAVSGRPSMLLSLDILGPLRQGHDETAVGIQAVPIERIRGSEGRCQDFDRHFWPVQRHTRDKWISVAATMLQGSSVPAVELLQVGDIYFVRDGHHRISVARALGWSYIDAQVTVVHVSGRLPWEARQATGHWRRVPA